MITSLKRVIKTGWADFARNAGLSVATIFIMAMVILLITLLFLINPASKVVIANLQDRVDISVYFKDTATPEDIAHVQSKLTTLPEVKDVVYASREQAFDRFVARHKDDPVLMESLVEIGANPFLASLQIRAGDVSQYASIASFLEAASFRNLIETVDYYERQTVIERVFAITSGITKAGLFLSIVFGIIAVLVAFNAIKIAILNPKEEIAVMRLVGASNWFIRGPFVMQGFLIGLFAAAITFFVILGLAFSIDARVKGLAPEISLVSLFMRNIGILLLVQLGTGVALGIISSMIAIRKYLKV